MSHQQEQEHANEEDIRSIEGSEWSVEEENIVGDGNAKQNEESNSKIALLEVNYCEGGNGNGFGKIFNSKLHHFSG
jgi:hypothetical protein